MIDQNRVAEHNATLQAALDQDYDALARKLARQNVDIGAITDQVGQFGVAIPSWGVGTGGTRFARFPGPGEPRDVFEKIADCGVIAQLTRATPTVSLHFPWDRVADMAALKQAASAVGLGFDAVNSNTFQDQPGQEFSYKFGSLSHADARVRDQAVRHNVDCIELGRALGSKALTVWIADGSNFPGQSSLGGALERYMDSARQIYAALPDDWCMLIEHKLYEPAFYSTVISDWGTSFACASQLGPKARCLVDLGHHAPSVNIEQIVARLVALGKLGGFHFNDSKYGDDDLDCGSIDPFRLFLVFNELVDADLAGRLTPPPAYMMDQSHNVTDPVESLMTSAQEIQRAYAQALLVDRNALAAYQADNDAGMALACLKAAFTTDVAPILAKARADRGGAIDPVGCFRHVGWRRHLASQRPAAQASGGGIV